MDTISIGELSDAASVPSSTIRYYEERGLLASAHRISGRRRVAPSAIQRLHLIGLCKGAGFNLDECRMLLADRGANRQASRDLAVAKMAEIDDQISKLESARALIELGLACQCPTLEECSCGAPAVGDGAVA